MVEEKKDTVDDVIEGDQPNAGSKEVKEEPQKEELTLEKVMQIAKATQKGYTTQQQDIAMIKNNLQAVVDAINNQSGASKGDDEYVTVSKLREIMAEPQRAVESANTYIDQSLAQFTAQGILNGKEDEDSLLNFALKVKEPDLSKAVLGWQEVKRAREEGKQVIAKKKVLQDEGSKIGSSSKTGGDKDTGVNYKEIRRMDWFNF